jgi:hypothetical protein
MGKESNDKPAAIIKGLFHDVVILPPVDEAQGEGKKTSAVKPPEGEDVGTVVSDEDAAARRTRGD